MTTVSSVSLTNVVVSISPAEVSAGVQTTTLVEMKSVPLNVMVTSPPLAEKVVGITEVRTGTGLSWF